METRKEMKSAASSASRSTLLYGHEKHTGDIYTCLAPPERTAPSTKGERTDREEVTPRQRRPCLPGAPPSIGRQSLDILDRRAVCLSVSETGPRQGVTGADSDRKMEFTFLSAVAEPAGGWADGTGPFRGGGMEERRGRCYRRGCKREREREKGRERKEREEGGGVTRGTPTDVPSQLPREESVGGREEHRTIIEQGRELLFLVRNNPLRPRDSDAHIALPVR